MYKTLVLTIIVVLAVSTVASAWPQQQVKRSYGPSQTQTTYASAGRVTSIWGRGTAWNYDNSNASAEQGMVTRGGAGYQKAESSTTGSSFGSSLWGTITSWFSGSAGTYQTQKF